MRKLTSFAAGLLFGMGLLLSGMTNPAKVIGFSISPVPGILAGAGDGRTITTAVLPLRAKARTRSLLDAPMQLPAKRELDGRLIGGSLLFGVGWGVAGICPGRRSRCC